MPNPNILTLEKLLDSVRSLSNQEQNQHLPPNVFTTHVCYMQNYLVDLMASQYPISERHISILRPFLKRKTIPVIDGKAELPEDYRHMFSVGTFVEEEDGKEVFIDACASFPGDPLQELAVDQNKKTQHWKSRKVSYLSIGEYNGESSKPYSPPSIKNPISCIFEDGILQVAPYDVKSVEIRYVRHPRDVKFGYIMLPDGTYQYNEAASVESEWHTNALSPMVNGLATLKATLSRDAEFAVHLDKIKQLLI